MSLKEVSMERGTICCPSGVLILASIFSVVTQADTIKVWHITNPANDGKAFDMEVTFFGAVDTKEPNNPRGVAAGRGDDPSDNFSGASGVGTSTLHFFGGSLAPGSTDNFRVKIMGDPKPGQNIISKVD